MDDATEAGMGCVCGHPAVAHIQPVGEACGVHDCRCVEFRLAVLGWPVRPDGTLWRCCSIWIELSDGTTARVWPPGTT